MIPALAAMHAERGGTRMAVLLQRLGASRESLRAAIRAATALGLIRRNPGYGHPLRPEYLLTETGRAVARGCATYADAMSEHAGAVAYRKWTAPILHALSRGCSRYSEIEQDLNGITPRALTTALRSLGEAGLVLREIEEGYPPRATYRLTETGQAAACGVLALAGALS